MKLKDPPKAGLLQRLIQVVCLALFLGLMLATAWPLGQTILPLDIFLRLDPLVATIVPVAAREFMPLLLPGLLVILSAVIFGRIFCGYVCPMGTTLDLVHRLSRLFSKSRNAPGRSEIKLSPGLTKLKYLILAGLLAAAVAGVNLALWGSPLTLITRFYALLVHPVLLVLGEAGLSAGQPIFEWLNLTSLSYLVVQTRKFETIYFILIFFGLIFALELVRPRFWCRYLCPTGGLLGLFSIKPLWRRRVAVCISCGKCAKACPTGAISPDGLVTRPSECIACRTCTDVCPAKGVIPVDAENKIPQPVKGNYFSFARPPQRLESLLPGALTPGAEQIENLTRRDRNNVPLPSRRAFLAAAGLGAALACMRYSSLDSLLRPGRRGDLWPETLVRPPGARPESAFLAKCIGCGNCMKVCPSNALQPISLIDRAGGAFTPVLTARRGPCEPDCNACGQVCPTQAILPLPMEQKEWAKMGTAEVLPYRCLAWTATRSCLVCQEVCPYGAIDVGRKTGSNIPAPLVNAARCYGCGYCENHCPVQQAAIVVKPIQALRLEHGDYKSVALAAGLDLKIGGSGHIRTDTDEHGLPPGFTE